MLLLIQEKLLDTIYRMNREEVSHLVFMYYGTILLVQRYENMHLVAFCSYFHHHFPP